MPKTRTKEQHQEKADEICEAAVRQLRGGGIEALSVASLARELSVAQNTIYWYYPSRDHLLVAAMGRMAQRAVSVGGADAEKAPATNKEAILVAVDRFAEIQPLRLALRDRGQKSPVVAEFQDRLQHFVREALREAFAGSVPEAEMDLAIETFMIASDGCAARGLGQDERNALLGFVLDRLGVK